MNKTQNKFNLMEVCGTHTMAIARHGLKKVFPPEVKMLSGPGCPICVTPIEDIDRAIALGGRKNVILATFGDMLHVPGSASSLEKQRSLGTDVRIVYSAVDAVDLAESNPEKEVVFLGVGFETTAPTIGAAIIIAKKRKVKNFSVLPMFKTIPNALRTILDMGKNQGGGPRIDGFLLPGHVSIIIGSKAYGFISKDFGIPGVIAGFEPKDIIDSVDMLLKQIKNGTSEIQNQYSPAVKPEGNQAALDVLAKVFNETASNWRAVGIIPKSGLKISSTFKDFDASKKFPMKTISVREPAGCLCGKILLGVNSPRQCRLFGNKCTPRDPVGPCMVSSEGSCAAEYKYGQRDPGDRKW